MVWAAAAPVALIAVIVPCSGALLIAAGVGALAGYLISRSRRSA